MVNCSPSPELPKLNGAPCEVPQSVDGQGTSSDSEDEQLIGHEGYELLPQQAEEEEQSTDDSTAVPESSQHLRQQGEFETGVQQGGQDNLFEEHDILKAEREERLQLWSGPGGRDIEPLDETRTQQVLQAMAGFSLPVSAVPDWASSVPEDQWRARLEERLKAMKTSTPSSPDQ